MDGDPLKIDGVTFAVYPEWIGRTSPVDELAFWAFLERTRARVYTERGRSPEEDFRRLDAA